MEWINFQSKKTLNKIKTNKNKIPFFNQTITKNENNNIFNDFKLPSKNEVVNILSKNIISFLKIIEMFDNFNELIISTFSISERFLIEIQKMDKKKVSLFISDINKFQKNLKPIIEKMKIDGFKVYDFQNHSKITLINESENYYVIIGSLNLQYSSNLEQLTIFNDKSIYNFYKQELEKRKNDKRRTE